ncbi:MAG: hypothetical protein AB1632_09295 [Nitrospirota bacterium]
MEELGKAVLRFNNGNLLKGYLKEFSPNMSELTFHEAGTEKIIKVDVDELKAIFFVKSFEGDRGHKEKKSYGISRAKGHRVFIKFNDGESLIGFLEGDVPWNRGFFLSKHNKEIKGFILFPVDLDSNNIKVFVIASSVKDVTVVP